MNLRRLLVWAGFGLVVVAFGFAIHHRAAPPQDFVARVGDRLITEADVRQEAERRLRRARPLPDKETLVEEMVTYEALLQRAHATELMEDPDIRREIQNLLIGKLKDRELQPQLDSIQVADEEVRAAYQDAIHDYTRPAKTRLAVLHLKASPKLPDGARQALRARLEAALAQLAQGPVEGVAGAPAGGFGQLAINCSDDPASRYRGGDLGWFDTGRISYRWPAEVLETGYEFPLGQPSEILDLDDGLFVVMKTDARDAVVTPFEDVQSSLRQRLLARKRKALEQSFPELARAAVEVKTNLPVLAALSLPEAGVTNLARNQDETPPAPPGGMQPGLRH